MWWRDLMKLDGKRSLDVRGKARTAESAAASNPLSDNERQLRIFKESVANSSDAVGMSTPDGKHYYQNKAFDDLFGEVGQDPPKTLYVDHAVGREVFRTIMAGGQWSGEVRMYAKDRSILTVLLRAYASKDETGRIAALVGVHTDITARQTAEARLRESTALLHSVSSGIPGAMLYQIIRRPDGGRRFAYVSEGVRLLYGCSPEEAVADSRRIYGRVCEEDRDRVIAEEEKAFREFTPLRTEVRMRNPDGSVRWSYFASNPRRLPDGSTAWDGIEINISERKSAEEWIAKEKQKAEDYLNIAEVILVAIDAEARITMINRKGCELLGYRADELIGQDWCKVCLPPEEYGAVFAVSRKIMAGELEPFEYYENNVLTRTGEKRLIAWHNTVLRDGYGAIIGTLSSGEDITARKAAEEKLRKSEEDQRTLIAALPDVIMRFDADCRHVFTSDNVAAVTGIPAAAFIGKTHHELGFPQPLCELWEHAIREPFRTGKTYETEFSIDGPFGPSTFNWRLTPDIDDAGRVRTVLAIARDITERKRAEEALRESEERLRATLASMTDLVFVLDKDGRFLDYHAAPDCPLYARPADFLGKTFGEVLPRPVAEALARQIEIVRTGANSRLDYELDMEGKRTFWSASITPRLDAAGRYNGVTVVSRDMTEPRRLEEQLRHREKMNAVGQLAGGIAHDFNNQLVGIMGFADLLVEALEDPELKDYAARIFSSASRAAELTRQMLAFSRRGKHLSTPVDVHAVIGEVVALLHRSIDKRITVRQELAARATVVLADPAQLQNAVLNLALNARDAMPEGGCLTLATDVATVAEGEADAELVRGEYIRIDIADNGIGMDAATRERLFEPFFTTKEPGKGTGLGLASAYGAVRNHGGTIRVRSELGRGSTFSIFLPVQTALPAPVQPAATPAAVGTAAAAVGRGRIMLVDDEATSLVLVTAMLKPKGYEVRSFADPAAALAHYRQEWRGIDLVIFDLMMPNLSGGELYRAMREVNPGITAILISGFGMDGEVQNILSLGAQAFLQKPFGRHELLEKVRELVVRA